MPYLGIYKDGENVSTAETSTLTVPNVSETTTEERNKQIATVLYNILEANTQSEEQQKLLAQIDASINRQTDIIGNNPPGYMVGGSYEQEVTV